jgi:hypothetical protein
MKRKNVQVNHGSFWYEIGSVELQSSFLAGDGTWTAEQMIGHLNTLRTELESRGFCNVKVKFESCGYESSLDVDIISDRPETDKEFEQRQVVSKRQRIMRKMAKEKKAVEGEKLRLETEAKEKQLLEDLKKKYEKC